MREGQIIKIVSNQYVVLSEGKQYPCIAMGKLRKDKAPVVGDKVLFEEFESQNGIQEILKRKNELIRPKIANVDQAILVMSCKDPNFSTSLLDRFIFQVSYENIHPVICITKMDLLVENDPVYALIEDYRKSGYELYEHDIHHVNDKFVAALANKISVLCGQSGAGKSSLLNRIEPKFALQTQEISKALGRGKHTTRHTQLHKVKEGWVADTPGFSSMDFTHMDKEYFAKCVPDFKDALDDCKFQNCIHDNEPGCEVKRRVEEGSISKIRYDDYLEVLTLIKDKKVKY